MDTATPAMLPTALRRKLLLLLVPPLWAAYTLSIVDRTNLAVAQLGGANNTAPHGMGQPPQYGGLGLSQAQFGLAAGVFFAGYSTAQVPVLQILVHCGARGGRSTDHAGSARKTSKERAYP